MRFCRFKMPRNRNRKVVDKKCYMARAQEKLTLISNVRERQRPTVRPKKIELVIDINSLVEYRSPSNKSIRLCKDNRSFIDNEGYWNVYPIAFNKAQVYVVCPHCGEIHLHGRGQEPDYKYEGHRACQCLTCKTLRVLHDWKFIISAAIQPPPCKNNGYVILRGNHA